MSMESSDLSAKSGENTPKKAETGQSAQDLQNAVEQAPEVPATVPDKDDQAAEAETTAATPPKASTSAQVTETGPAQSPVSEVVKAEAPVETVQTEAPVEVPVTETETRQVADPAQSGPAELTEAGEEATAVQEQPAAREPAEEEPEPIAFDSLALHKDIQGALKRAKFTHCTPIQAQTLPHTLAGQDLIGQAQTGTGKTAAFLLTLLQRFLANPIPWEERYASEPRALVVAPTRELALQIEKDARELSKGVRLNIMSVIGGTQLDKARARLRDEAIDLLIATPGRLLDHLTSRDVYLDQVEVLVLDEADRMLDMGFIPDVKRIVRATPMERQTLLFSATFNQDIINLAKRWTRDPIEVMLAVDHVPADTVEQIVYLVEGENKIRVLVNLLSEESAERAIVFCNRRDETHRLSKALSKANVSNAIISGELPQAKRMRTLEEFRTGKFKTLVATDVAGRGLHIDGVTHVVNYNLPDDPEDYVHRIGRTGRAGESGVSISFACEDDAFLIPDLEKYLGSKLSLTQPPEELLKT